MTTTQIDALAAKLTESGLRAKAWKGQRIYINGLGRDISAYITLDEPDVTEWTYLFEGCALKVFSNCNQDRSWKINRAKQVKHGLMQDIHAAGVCGDLEAPCENWREVIL